MGISTSLTRELLRLQTLRVKRFDEQPDLEHLSYMQSPYQTQIINSPTKPRAASGEATKKRKFRLPTSAFRKTPGLLPAIDCPDQLTPHSRSPIIAVSRLSSRARDPVLHLFR